MAIAGCVGGVSRDARGGNAQGAHFARCNGHLGVSQIHGLGEDALPGGLAQ